jgi:hypothetical protein
VNCGRERERESFRGRRGEGPPPPDISARAAEEVGKAGLIFLGFEKSRFWKNYWEVKQNSDLAERKYSSWNNDYG